MIRAIFILIFIVLCASIAVWLSEHPGEIVINWNDYQMEMSLMVGIQIQLLAFAIMLCTWGLLRFLFGFPERIKMRFRQRRQTNGYNALSEGIMALYSKDVRSASRFALKATKLLKNDPLAILLEAHSAQMRCDWNKARDNFAIMLSSPKTERLGLYGLFIDARRQDNRERAKELATQALKIDINTIWASEALFDIQCAAGEWDEALRILANNQSKRIINESDAKRRKAVLLMAKAIECDVVNSRQALKLSLEAHNLAPELVPAAALSGCILLREKSLRKAKSIIGNTWKQHAHPELAKLYAQILIMERQDDYLKIMQTFAGEASDKQEGLLALARTAIDAREWSLARKTLTSYLKSNSRREAYLLMATVEEGEYGNATRANKWLAQAASAPHDPAWVADNIISPVWKPVSPRTGRLDAFEWRPLYRITPTIADSYNEKTQERDGGNIADTQHEPLAGAVTAVKIQTEISDKPPLDNTLSIETYDTNKSESTPFCHNAPDDPGSPDQNNDHYETEP